MPGPSILPCPECGEASVKCTDSRPDKAPSVLRRRRYKCESCGFRFKTSETLLDADPYEAMRAAQDLMAAFDTVMTARFGENWKSKIASTDRSHIR